MAISLVQAKLGVTVLPECLLGVGIFDRVAAVNLTEPWANRAIYIATQRGRIPSPPARAFMSQLLDTPRVLGSEKP